jgi:hypothetical protein
MDTLSALLHLQYEKNSPVRSVLYHQSHWYDGTGVTSLAQKTWPGGTRQDKGRARACLQASSVAVHGETTGFCARQGTGDSRMCSSME